MKYSIVINHISNDQYALVINSYELDNDGLKINEQTNVETELSFVQVQEKISNL
jgi:hypothetical protein